MCVDRLGHVVLDGVGIDWVMCCLMEYRQTGSCGSCWSVNRLGPSHVLPDGV